MFCPSINIAVGLIVSFLIIPNEILCCKAEQEIYRIGMHNQNVFAHEELARDFLKRHFPEWTVMLREGDVSSLDRLQRGQDDRRDTGTVVYPKGEGRRL